MIESLDVIFLAGTCIKESYDFRIRGFHYIRADANTVDKRGMLEVALHA